MISRNRPGERDGAGGRFRVGIPPRSSVLRRLADLIFIAAVVIGWGCLLDLWFLAAFGLWGK